MAKLLLVEDDESLGRTLHERLQKEGYQVQWTRTKAEARQACRSDDGSVMPFDLVVLDIGLPDGSGLDLARDLRLQGDVAILFLSALSSAEYRLEGFELGALDYIPKPFHLKELLLRVRRALESREVKAQLVAGPITLDLESMTVHFVDGTKESPAVRDFQLLRLLVQHSPRVISREEILKELWPGDVQQTGRTVDNAIVRLRQLVRRIGEDHIRSVRGVGYQWVNE